MVFLLWEQPPSFCAGYSASHASTCTFFSFYVFLAHFSLVESVIVYRFQVLFLVSFLRVTVSASSGKRQFAF
jgi:hypothetical protein